MTATLTPAVGKVAATGTSSNQPQSQQQHQQPQRRSYASLAASPPVPAAGPNPTQRTSGEKCMVCSAAHQAEDCNVLWNAGIEERREMLRQKSLCFRCLGQGHSARFCKARICCGTCSSITHPTLLHVKSFQPRQQSVNAATTGNRFPSEDDAARLTAAAAATSTAPLAAGRQPTPLMGSGDAGGGL